MNALSLTINSSIVSARVLIVLPGGFIDVLELTQGNRKIALCTVVGLLEDGETYSTELRQRQKPGQGKMGQWEHELVCQVRFNRSFILINLLCWRLRIFVDLFRRLFCF